MRRLIVALGFLTRLPMPRSATSEADFAAAVRLYPLAGLAIGVVVAGAGRLGTQLDPWIGALAALSTWVWITGALHLDGLGDIADALGAAHSDRNRMLAVMADPHVGSFGIVVITLQLIAKLVLLHTLLSGHWIALLAVPAAARVGPLIWARWLPPLRPAGLGARIAGAVRGRDVAGWLLVLAGAATVFPALMATPLVIGAILLWLKIRVGGVTGDAHGAGIELVETALLFIMIVID